MKDYNKVILTSKEENNMVEENNKIVNNTNKAEEVNNKTKMANQAPDTKRKTTRIKSH